MQARKSTAILALIGALALPALASAQADEGRWIGTWSTGPLALDPPASPAEGEAAAALPFGAPVRLANQTLRQVVRTSIGGSEVRITISNLFGTEPVAIGTAHVALRDEAARIGDGAPLTFGGKASVTVEGGSTVLSDPVALEVPALSDLAIDLYLPGDTWGTKSPATVHTTGLTTNYVSPTGDHTGAAELPVETTVQQWFFLTRVDVRSATAPGAIVTVGDSITDGTGSTPDTNSRWPDFLARRLAEAYGDRAPAVLNVGIAGNRLLSDNPGLAFLRQAGLPVPESDEPPNPNAMFGPKALSRLDRDVLLQPGATHVIVLESINDIGMAFDADEPTAMDLIAAHRTLIQRAHAQGLTIYGGTLTPFEGALYWTSSGEAKRQAVNTWIRTSGEYDAVFDFDAAVRDPDAPNKFRPEYHPGDWLHANDAGYEAMAAAIDLSLFDPAKPGRPASAAPRTAWGAPDLGGIWDFRTITPLERPEALADKPVLTPEEAAAFAEQSIAALNADVRPDDAAQDVERAYNDFWWDWGDSLTEDLRTSLIVDPPDGRIPARVVGIDEADDARRAGWHRPIRERVVFNGPARGPEDLGLSERCMLGFNAGPPMLPSAYNNNLQFFQTPDHVVIYSEMVHDARIVPLSDQPHLPESIRQWLGDSRGHWEGDTLVVESTNFTGKTGSFYTIIDSYGSGATLRLEERFTRVDADTLLYSFTVDDPATFTRPITAEIPMRRTDAPLFEYACHEGNYGMTNLLAGARVQERRAAEAEAGADGR